MTGTKVEAIHHHGVGDRRALRRRARAGGRAAPRRRPAEGVHGSISGGRPRRAARRSSAARPTSPPARRVAVALPGAVMPDGTKLKQAKLRGVALRRDDPVRGTSSSSAPAREGILVLDELTARRRARARHAARATCCRSRPRCSSSRSPPTGPTASACTASRASCTPPPARRSRPRPGARTPAARPRRGVARRCEVLVECPELCPRFTARVFEDVTIAPSPPWLKARLTAAGQRPINNVVDITNYAMLLTGQPLHAFDLDRVAGARLTVRRAHDGEQVQTLDGQTRTLDSRDGRDRGRRGPDLDRRADGRRALGGAAPTPRACCWRSPPGTAPTSTAARGRSGCAARPPRASRRGSQPEQCMHAQAVATRADDRAVRRARRAGHDRRRLAADAPAPDDPAARGARAGDPRRAGRARAPGARS